MKQRAFWKKLLNWRTFRKKLFNRRTFLVMGVLLLLSIWCDRLWILQYPGVVLMQHADREKTPVEAKHVIIVTITPEEYKELFSSRSPLSAEKLSEAICMILMLKPGVLAIDIDTSDDTFSWFAQKYSRERIVWGRGVRLSEQSLQPGGFAGGETQPSLISGIAGFERDPDWAVRNIDECVTIGGKRIPTFHHVIYLESKGLEPYACENSETHRLPGVRYRFPTLTLTEVEGAVYGNPAGEENLLSGKIVLLGGLYSPADYHAGPNGSVIPGVELVASAVEAEFAEASSSEMRERVLGLLVDAAFGIFIIWLYSHRRPSGLVKLGVSLAIAAFVLFVPGVLLYYWAIWAVNPFPLVIGMIMHQMYEAAEGSEGGEKEKVVIRHTSTTRVSQEEVRVTRTEE